MSSDIFGNFSEKYSFTGAFFSDSTLMYIWKENFAFGWLGFGTAKLDSTRLMIGGVGKKKRRDFFEILLLFHQLARCSQVFLISSREFNCSLSSSTNKSVINLLNTYVSKREINKFAKGMWTSLEQNTGKVSDLWWKKMTFIFYSYFEAKWMKFLIFAILKESQISDKYNQVQVFIS